MVKEIGKMQILALAFLLSSEKVTFTAHLPGASNCAIIVAAINCNNKGLR